MRKSKFNTKEHKYQVLDLQGKIIGIVWASSHHLALQKARSEYGGAIEQVRKVR